VNKSPLAKTGLFLLLSAVAVVCYLFLLSVFHGKLGAFSATVPAMLLALAALIMNWRFLRSEGRSLMDLGFDAPRLGRVTIGFLAGCLLVGAWALALRAGTSVAWHITPTFDPLAAFGSVTFAFFNNAGEELLYRGYLFLLLARSYGRAAAVIGTCSLFTLLHMQAGLPWPSAVAGVLTSALVFAALFVRWQSVPLVLAFHVATNVLQELLGLRVSALTLFVPTFETKPSESQSHTVLAIIGLVNTALALAIFAYARSRNTTAGHRSRPVRANSG
jgi:membrane protease YdiL (CAAX protease family)